jgi:hypothetical protein
MIDLTYDETNMERVIIHKRKIDLNCNNVSQPKFSFIVTADDKNDKNGN